MPPNKKRKAAKRKKEQSAQQSSDSPTDPPLAPQGNDHNDGGSPTSRDGGDHHLTEEEAEEKAMENHSGSSAEELADPPQELKRSEEKKAEASETTESSGINGGLSGEEPVDPPQKPDDVLEEVNAEVSVIDWPADPSQELEEASDAVGELGAEGAAVESEEISVSPTPPLEVREDVSVEIIRSETVGESCEGTVAESPEGLAEESDGLVERVLSVYEGVARSVEAMSENPDDSAVVETLCDRIEVNALPLSDFGIERSGDDLGHEIAPKEDVPCDCQTEVNAVPPAPSDPIEVNLLPPPDKNTVGATDDLRQIEVARAPVAERRASLCGCCGLFDVLMGSQR